MGDMRPGQITALAVAAGTLLAVMAGEGTAMGGTAASVTVTIAVAPRASSAAQPPPTPPVRSVTVSPAVVTYGDCSGAYRRALSFPNGRCVSAGVQVRNGAAPARIEVAGAAAVPADGGRRWTLCGGAGAPACSGPSEAPGSDQYSERTAGQERAPGAAGDTLLSDAPECDLAFGSAGCRARPGQIASERLALTGPAASSDRSTTFTTTVIWAAT